MNRREFIIIAEVIRELKENAHEWIHYGYSLAEVESAMATINDLQDHMVYRLKEEYPKFDESKFIEACKA